MSPYWIYRAEKANGSEAGPVVYYRNCTGKPFVNYTELANRWSISRSTAGGILNKLADHEYITLLPFEGRRRCVIYLNNYLSTMFEISDVMIDKEEVALSLKIQIEVPDKMPDSEYTITEEQMSVSVPEFSVPKSHLKFMLQKIVQVLSGQGLACCQCPNSLYILSPLSNSKENGTNEEFLVPIF